ncbi:putative N-acetyltransferase [Pseudocercospora fuligena]|uniref:Putative N-acetyltransferase n=1 Tax=Pseudocercospora fuligena TaxID=685502 RepID=A0A8H6RIB6_9PEZI|nr:putative N-acetyltransferase [Pseudocercospora fuligena]
MQRMPSTWSPGIRPHVLIRRRIDQDTAQLISCLGRVYQKDGYPTGIITVEDRKQFLDSNSILHTWVAESNHQAIAQVSVCSADVEDNLAMAAWRKKSPNDEVAVLGRLFVDPDSRGSGLAKQLVSQAMQWGRANGVRLVLWVLAKHDGATRLYEKLGWELFDTAVFHSKALGQDFDALCFVAPESSP